MDTNILVHASRPASPDHDSAANALRLMARDGTPHWLSHQVLREYLAASTRPQRSGPALPMAAAVTDIRRFRSLFNVAPDSENCLDMLTSLLASYPGGGRQVHDANIVATTLAAGISRLLTFNGADFRRFGPLIEIIDP